MFRLRWLVYHLASPEFHRQLRRQLSNPAKVYLAMLTKCVKKWHRYPVEVQFKDGKRIFIQSFSTIYVFDEIFIKKIYDVKLQTVQSIIDIGANTGLFVVRAKQLWPDAKIIAFEPEPRNFAELCRTVVVNHFEDVIPVNAAIGCEPGTTTLYIHQKNIGGHSTVHRPRVDTMRVACQTLADALGPLPEGRCDLMKMDCEGAEEEIFRGLTPAIAERIRAIVYEPEWARYNVDDLNRCLARFGFEIQVGPDVVFAQRMMLGTEPLH